MGSLSMMGSVCVCSLGYIQMGKIKTVSMSAPRVEFNTVVSEEDEIWKIDYC